MENLLSKVLRGDQVLILFCLVDLIILFLVCTKCFFFFFLDGCSGFLKFVLN